MGDEHRRTDEGAAADDKPARIHRPDEDVKDLEPAEEAGEEVRGGYSQVKHQ